jgi:hypothetical protein
MADEGMRGGEGGKLAIPLKTNDLMLSSNPRLVALCSGELKRTRRPQSHPVVSQLSSSMTDQTSGNMGVIETLDFYDRYLLAIGRLCATWSVLDRELNSLLAALLDVDEPQIACIATEMNDVAPRCRLVKTLLYTVDVPADWRADVAELCNIISNQIGPSRNRLVHDRFGVSEDQILKMDRRAKLIKPTSFSDLKLEYDREELVDKDTVENVALKAMAASARLATARFDLEYLKRENTFPEEPSLERWRVKSIPELQFPPES